MRKSIIAATAAIVLVLAAGAGAASRYLITSVHQIKPNVLRQLHGASGPPGARGPAGPAGAAGATGSVGHVDAVVSETLTLQPGQSSYDVDPSHFQATCPVNEVVTGTGFDDGAVTSVGYVESYTYFVGGIFFNDSSIPAQVALQAVCAPVAAGLEQTATAHRTASPEAAYHSDLRRAAMAHPVR